MVKLAITGGLGFIGTNLVYALMAEGITEIRLLDNGSNPSGDLAPSSNVVIYTGDVRDPDALRSVLKGVDGVIHLAAHTRVVESVETPIANFDVNVRGTLEVLEAMRACAVPSLINASTGGAILGEIAPPIHEEMAARPASPYGASKLAAEGYCSAYAQSYGLKIVSLRFSNIYGPYSRNKGSVVAAFIKQVREQGRVTVFGDGTQTRDYLYVADLVSGIIAAWRSGYSGVYQLGSGRATSLNELIATLRTVTRRNFDVSYQNLRPGELRHTYCDIGKARRDFGFAPAVDLLNGVTRTWEWFESHVPN